MNEYKGPKLRVGVVNFQNKTPSRVLGIGEAAADILGTILQKTDRFIVIPQQDIESILAQQRMGATGVVNPDTAAQMGQVLGLNAIVTGCGDGIFRSGGGLGLPCREEQKADSPGHRRLPYRGHHDRDTDHGGFRCRHLHEIGQPGAGNGLKGGI